MRKMFIFLSLVGLFSGVYLVHAQELPPISPPTVAAPPAAVTPAVTPSTPPGSATVPAAPAAAATPGETPTAPVIPPPKIREFTYKTLMFLPTEMESIAKVEADYIRVKSGQALASDNTPTETPKAPEVDYYFPQFYLNSIAYHNPADWVVWINGEKYILGSTKERETLFIKSVDDKAIVVEWRPDLTEKITLALPNTPGVVIDKESRIITFTLQPNQTFLSYNMKIVEGKRAPLKMPPQGELALIETLSGALPNVNDVLAPPTTPSGPPSAMPTTPPASGQPQTGLPGLIHRYQDIDKP